MIKQMHLTSSINSKYSNTQAIFILWKKLSIEIQGSWGTTYIIIFFKSSVQDSMIVCIFMHRSISRSHAWYKAPTY